MRKIFVFLSVFFVMVISVSANAVDCNSGGRYEDSPNVSIPSDGTVTDCRTGLIWLKNANCGDTANSITPNPANGTLSWYDAMKWVKGLEQGICGLNDGSSAGDWRLPTKTEWMAMAKFAKRMGYTIPALTNGDGTAQWTTNGDTFNNVQSYDYWSNTTFASFTAHAWAINMWGGLVNDLDKTLAYLVWPVRGGQSATFDTLTLE